MIVSTNATEHPNKIKYYVLETLYFIFHWIGLFRLFYLVRRRRVLILAYHNVIPDELFDGSIHLGTGHKTSEFQRQLAFIASRFEIVTDFAAQGPQKCIVTFDDGYANNIGAAQYLTSLGARGVFFVPVEPLSTGRTLVIDQVLLWFSYVPQGNHAVAGKCVTIADDCRAEALGQFYRWMVANITLWNEVPNTLDASFPFAKLPIANRLYETRFRPMSVAELMQLAAEGHSIGCHSWDHRPLAALSDDELRQDFENCESQRAIFNTNTYCYPFGRPLEVDARAKRACAAFGYEHGLLFTFTEGEHTDRFAVPRLSLPPKLSRYSLDAKLSGFESAVRSAIGRS